MDAPAGESGARGAVAWRLEATRLEDRSEAVVAASTWLASLSAPHHKQYYLLRYNEWLPG